MFYAILVDIRSNNLQEIRCFIHLLTSLYKQKKTDGKEKTDKPKNYVESAQRS